MLYRHWICQTLRLIETRDWYLILSSCTTKRLCRGKLPRNRVHFQSLLPLVWLDKQAFTSYFRLFSIRSIHWRPRHSVDLDIVWRKAFDWVLRNDHWWRKGLSSGSPFPISLLQYLSLHFISFKYLLFCFLPSFLRFFLMLYFSATTSTQMRLSACMRLAYIGLEQRYSSGSICHCLWSDLSHQGIAWLAEQWGLRVIYRTFYLNWNYTTNLQRCLFN